MDQASGLTETILVADLGGTNARFALADRASLALANVMQFPCRAHAGIEAAIRSYLTQVDSKPEYASIAIAAPVTGDGIVFTNSRWSFTISTLRRELGFNRLFVLNDFEAFALALPSLGANDIMQIGGTEPRHQCTKVAIGIGTGTGMAGLVSGPSGWVVVPSEGGHASFAPPRRTLPWRSGCGWAGRISPSSGSSPDQVSVLCTKRPPVQGIDGERLEPNDVLTRALSRTDPIAVEALNFFVRCLGRFAGDAALTFGARGGVYLGGGITPRILEFLAAGPFRDEFENKGRMKPYLAPIPVYAVLAEHATLRGAAIAARSELPALPA